jgi:hypothetical protein
LHELLTPKERRRRLSRTADDERMPSHRAALSGLGTPAESTSKVGSPLGASPSRFGGFLARQQQEKASEASLNESRNIASVEPQKGILRRPTNKFPEHHPHVREGVGPLKDPALVPPEAKWTKIDRRLVNPKSLMEKNERFEERQDCVIVLRVLTKDEVQAFADRTAEIRGEL